MDTHKRIRFTAELVESVEGRDIESILINLFNIGVLTKKDIITIETRLDIEVELYDMIGNKVINESNAKRLDLSKLPNGIYNMVILYNDVRFSKKVIKQ